MFIPHFNQSARTYDEYTPIQYLCSHYLARFIHEHHPNENAFCDLGAGTGYLTQALMKFYPKASYHLIDCAPEMILTCQEKWGERCSYEVEDIQTAVYQGLPVSNFTFQWLREKPRFQRIAFTTLLKGTWAPWAHQAGKFGIHTHVFQEEGAWTSWMKENRMRFSFFTQTHTIVYKTVFDFLHTIRKMGGSGLYSSPQYLRPLLLSFKSEIVVPYKVLYVCSY